MLVNMRDEEFTHHLQALITKKLEKDKNLKQEANRYWREITVPHAYIFDRGWLSRSLDCILFFH
jgi:secreted Zn-dependent insulinase-like peptidase